MSKLLVNLALLQTKALVNAYTWSTLPFYALAQRPWQRLKLSRATGVKMTIDQKTGRTIYSRPSPVELEHPYLNCHSFNEIVPFLDRNRKIVGVREVLNEVIQLDEKGNVIKIDGKELKKVELSPSYRFYTVGEILDQADAFARGLQKMGVKEGEKVIIYSDNSLQWFIASLALNRLNVVTVLLLSILNDKGIVYGINQCDARYIITSQDLIKKIDRLSSSIDLPLNVVYIPNKLEPSDDKLKQCVNSLQSKSYQINTYDQVQQDGYKEPATDFPIANLDSMSMIMYTSGTTGNPKGVILTHRNMATGLHNMLRYDNESKVSFMNAVYPAFLPFGHIFGSNMNGLLFISKALICFCSPQTLLDSSPAHINDKQKGDLGLIKPEMMAGVPLLLDRILKEIYRKLNVASPIAPAIFTYLVDYKIRWRQRGFDTPILNKYLSKRIKGQFGGKLSIMLVGSAPLNKRTQAMFQEILDIKLIQAYGSTEIGGASHLTLDSSLTYGHSGVPLHGIQFYLKDWEEGGYFANDKPNPRGEIVIGSHTISQGYYKMPEETAESFYVDDKGVRWFLTGDIGEVLPDGNLKIIDRKKDLTKLANGEFVALGKIESALRSSLFVENICVCTDAYSNHVTALICPNRRTMEELAIQLKKSNLTFDELCQDVEIIQYIANSLRSKGTELGLAKKELPVDITLVTEEWTPDSNLLTAAMKMKRKQVNIFYQEQIKAMFKKTNASL